MGILSRIFGQHSIERDLERTYIAALQLRGMSAPEAKYVVSGWLREARDQAKREDSTSLPANCGDYFLANEQVNPKVRELLAKKRKQGVGDDDIRWWWNLHDLERRLMKMDDDTTRLAAFTEAREKGMTIEEAAAHVSRFAPVYGDPSDAPNACGDDRPLPYELKDRVNRLIEGVAGHGTERIRAMLTDYTTMNAFIRRQMNDGKH